MPDVVNLFNPNGDLEKPVWFYQQVEALADDAFQGFGELIEKRSRGGLTYEHLYNAIAETPVKLVLLSDRDQELQNHIVLSAVARMWMDFISSDSAFNWS